MSQRSHIRALLVAPLMAITLGLMAGGTFAFVATEPGGESGSEAVEGTETAILIPAEPEIVVPQALPMPLPKGLRVERPKTERELYTASICRMIELSAKANGLPPGFLARLIWQESRFDRYARSPVGAQGIAQFMPYTAEERGLEDPDDPRQAIPASAGFLRHLHDRFGNLGLAAAAYNGGPNRVARWLAGHTSLALETENYVRIITRRPADYWREPAGEGPDLRLSPDLDFRRACNELPALLRKEKPPEGPSVLPWGAQVAAHFQRDVAVAAFERAKRAAPAAFGGAPLNVTRARIRSRGRQALYRAALGAPSRDEAEGICAGIRRSGGACIVVKH